MGALGGFGISGKGIPGSFSCDWLVGINPQTAPQRWAGTVPSFDVEGYLARELIHGNSGEGNLGLGHLKRFCFYSIWITGTLILDLIQLGMYMVMWLLRAAHRPGEGDFHIGSSCASTYYKALFVFPGRWYTLNGIVREIWVCTGKCYRWWQIMS